MRPSRYFTPMLLAVALAAPALALQPTAATGSVQYAFTPGDRADDMIIEAIAGARRQVLVQAFSFTHRRIAEALIKARRRGVEVAVIADHEQTYRIETSVISDIAEAGVPVLLDAEHASAHNKIIVIDADRADCAVITGSYNLTHAAQFRNAENALILKGNPPLCAAYRRNWNQHKTHSLPYAR
ncbi:MAG: phospholipase D family protein [Sulfuricaulis sp.]|nr:phospholipase D family protein [Sulfuricaulis sp.]